MGPFRLWWIPDGAGPADGTFVHQPVDDLLDLVALESARHDAVVVGEDLGTVEPRMREEMARRNVLSYRLLWFEDEPPSAWPEHAMAAITTHDLPTVRGLWDGSDLATLHRLGVPTDDDGVAAIRQHLVTVTGLPDDADVGSVVVAAHRALGRAPATMLCTTLDDLMAVGERPNIPGAGREHPNWSLALPRPIDDLDDEHILTMVGAELNGAITPDRSGSTA
jgi:4-alpha-glucanotransferase